MNLAVDRWCDLTAKLPVQAWHTVYRPLPGVPVAPFLLQAKFRHRVQARGEVNAAWHLEEPGPEVHTPVTPGCDTRVCRRNG